MPYLNNLSGAKKRRVLVLSCLFYVSLAAASARAQTNSWPDKRTVAPIYTVTNLGGADLATLPVINASGQVVFSVSGEGGVSGWFYDGTSVIDLGTLGGTATYANALNDLGQVAGFSTIGTDTLRAFRWTKATGMADLGALIAGQSAAVAINASGIVVGSTGRPPFDPYHAFRWSESTGMEDLGRLATDYSSALAINAAGLIAGISATASNDMHAFAWTRTTGMVDIGTLGGNVAYPVAVGAAGEVAGYSTIGSLAHAFLWTRGGGMRDLGTLGGIESGVLAMTPQTDIAGVINTADGGQHAMAWTPAGGMVDLGTFGGLGSSALGLNTKGQVVGGAMTVDGDHRAFLWTQARGMVDLNSRLQHPPAGLKMDIAIVISDKGQIVATSNAGLVLLTPVGLAHMRAPAVGPIAAPGLVQAGTPLAVSASFSDEDLAAAHNVSWSWGDGGAAETGIVTESGGAGSSGATHNYSAPGLYTIVAKVRDAKGRGAAVSRTVVVHDAARGHEGGNGAMLSPPGADKRSPLHAGKASFSFIAPTAAVRGGAGQLNFHAPNLIFRSTTLSPVTAQGARGQYAGSGTIGGRGAYQFALAVSGAEPGKARVGIRIWHADPKSGAMVVDYDNRNDAGGQPITAGLIAVQP